MQAAHEQRRGTDPVDVVVPVDVIRARARAWASIALAALAAPANAARVVLLAGVQERAGELSLVEPTAHEHLRERPAHSQRLAQPHDLLQRAIRYLETNRSPARAPTVRSGADGTVAKRLAQHVPVLHVRPPFARATLAAARSHFRCPEIVTCARAGSACSSWLGAAGASKRARATPVPPRLGAAAGRRDPHSAIRSWRRPIT